MSPSLLIHYNLNECPIFVFYFASAFQNVSFCSLHIGSSDLLLDSKSHLSLFECTFSSDFDEVSHPIIFFWMLEIRTTCFGGSGYFLFSAYAFPGLFTGMYPFLSVLWALLLSVLNGMA